MILNDTRAASRDAVRAFAHERIRPESARFEREQGYPDWVFREMATLGVMGMTAPEV